MVEAAMLFPVILLIVFGFIRLSLTLYEQVSETLLDHGKKSVLENIVTYPEDLLRSEWVLTKQKERKKGQEDTEDKGDNGASEDEA